MVIYALSDPRTGSIRYVGKTVNPASRRRFHNNDHTTPTRRRSWIQSLRDDGLRPIFEVLEMVEEDSWEEAERFWIGYLRFLGCSLTNHDLGGNGTGKVSDETRAKQAARKRGRTLTPEHRRAIAYAHRGKKLTPEHRAHLSIAKTGRTLSPGTKEKLRLINLGKTHPPRSMALREHMSRVMRGRTVSAEARLKMRAAKLGRPMPEATRKKISVSTRGEPKSKEHAAAVGRAHRGKTLSAIAIAKRTATRYGRPLILP